MGTGTDVSMRTKVKKTSPSKKRQQAHDLGRSEGHKKMLIQHKAYGGYKIAKQFSKQQSKPQRKQYESAMTKQATTE